MAGESYSLIVILVLGALGLGVACKVRKHRPIVSGTSTEGT